MLKYFNTVNFELPSWLESLEIIRQNDVLSKNTNYITSIFIE